MGLHGGRMLRFMEEDQLDVTIVEGTEINEAEFEEESSKEEEEMEPPTPTGIFSRTNMRNQRSRKSRKAGKRCYSLLKNYGLIDPHVHGCGCNHSPALEAEMHDGTGSNREGCHNQVHGPIGEGSDPEPRTEGTGIPEAALAREIDLVSGLSEPEDVSLVSETSEPEIVTCPIERYRLELQERLKCIPADFDAREVLRDQWMTVHDRLPEELCQDMSDMQEIIRRATCDKGEHSAKKMVRFDDNGGAEVRPLSIFTKPEIAPSGVRALSAVADSSKPSEEGWVEIEITIDSGACDTVMPAAMCGHISIVQTEDSRRGVEYEVANGETIPNLGERHCFLMTEDSHIMKEIVFQCADIHKPLLSVSRCADLGYQCILEKLGGKLKDTVTGEEIPIHRRGNLYVMRAWVRQNKPAGFARPQ